MPQCLWQRFRKQGSWQRPDRLIIFLLVWSVTVFIFFQNMATKYITYTYPLLFPLALLLGDFLAKNGSRAFNKGYLFFHGSGYVLLTGAVYWCRLDGVIPMRYDYLVLVTVLGGAVLVYAMASYRKNILL